VELFLCAPFYAFMAWKETILSYFPFYRDKFIFYSVVFILLKLRVETVIGSYLLKRSKFMSPGSLLLYSQEPATGLYLEPVKSIPLTSHHTTFCGGYICNLMPTYVSFFVQFFGRVRKIAKSVSFVISVRPSAWNNSAVTKWIFMNFDILVFFEKVSKKLKFL
jgi:hypothetical protein